VGRKAVQYCSVRVRKKNDNYLAAKGTSRTRPVAFKTEARAL